MRVTFLNVTITVEGHDADDAYLKLEQLMANSEHVESYETNTYVTEKNLEPKDTFELCNTQARAR